MQNRVVLKKDCREIRKVCCNPFGSHKNAKKPAERRMSNGVIDSLKHNFNIGWVTNFMSI